MGNRGLFGLSKPRRSVMIGVIDRADLSQLVPTNSYFADESHSECTAYAFYTYDGSLLSTLSGSNSKRKSYGLPWTGEDAITMTLDLTDQSGTLSFRINGQDQGIAFCDIDVSKQYILSVSFFYEEGVQIVQE